MADDTPTARGALPETTPTEPLDIMNDDAFNPPKPSRQDTFSSKVSEGGSVVSDTCRICRSEGTPDEPLFYPCKCSGSIKFVHQECLMEWLSHSHKKHCELCKTPFRFTKLYDRDMPQTLPWGIFLRRACWHVILGIGRLLRISLVCFVWLGTLPWLIRHVWRYLLWMADAAWAREAFVNQVLKSTPQDEEQIANGNLGTMFYQWWLSGLTARWVDKDGSTKTSSVDGSILSSWTYLSSMTPDPSLNRIILDVFEGQLITCVVIVGFILVFLIREWVVQQQPLVNLENLGNVQQQLRDAAERVQADNVRLRRQQDLLDQARRRLIELQNETEGYAPDSAQADGQGSAEGMDYIGWDALDAMIDDATDHLRKGGEAEHAHFAAIAELVTKQIRVAGGAGESLDEFTDKVYQKLAGYSEEERREWEAILVSEIEKSASARKRRREQTGVQSDEHNGDATQGSDAAQEENSTLSNRRPPMPEREFSSRATHIQRLLAEAEDVFNHTDAANAGNETPRSTDVEPGTDNASDASAPSTESWQVVSLPGETDVPEFDEVAVNGSPSIPITNAGPDARINIKRSAKNDSKTTSVPKIEEKMLNDDEELSKLKDEVAKEVEDEKRSDAAPAPDAEARTNEQLPGRHRDNPFHPEGPEPEPRDLESFTNRVAEAFRDEFGLDEAEELENLRQAGLGPDGETATNDGQLEERPHRPADVAPTYFQRLTDWFWGDIHAPETPEPVPAANEERAPADGQDDGQVAPFVPVQNGQPVPAAPEPPPAADADAQQPQNDPEVLAAAQQAGLDPEAVEDAEDLEGILELIGLQGPFIGLFQTSAFCLLLVACTVLGAVVVPYLVGKLVLSLTGNPVYFLVQMPLHAASSVAEFLVDVTLALGGWTVMLFAMAVDFMLTAAQQWAPALGRIKFMETVIEYAASTATSAGHRLQGLLTMAEPSEGVPWSFAFIGWSVHAHASLRTIQAEVNAVLSYAGAGITSTVETVSAGAVLDKCTQALLALPIRELPAMALQVVQLLGQYCHPILDFLSELRRGAVTFSRPEIPTDPSLVFWSSTDRTWAVLAGYAALAALAAIYVAVDTPITKSENGRKTEKMIRDTLRQAGGVFKVILIISIEMLVFPLYCGMLLDFAFLPLFQNASVATRWAFAGRRPYMFCFVHWFVGTCYMFHFALFVGMCRKILRKGVLWFIRDPDDPTFHPVRDVLERNVATQLRKIAFSALVYGALVILCLGGVIWTIGRVFEGMFPIHWVSTEPILEFPLDLLLYNFVTPLVIRLFKPSDTVNAMYAWWLRRCARGLRLSHFLFDDRQKDEEGHLNHKSWTSLLLMKKPSTDKSDGSEDQTPTTEDEQAEVSFKSDGRYVLTPCSDQYRPPKPGEAFLHADDNDVYIADKDGKKNDHFCKVYVPPLFKLRVSLFLVCLWIFSAFMGLCSTLLPLGLGRYLLSRTMPHGLRVNDIYAYSIGAYILGGAMFVALNGKAAASFLKKKASVVDLKAWIEPLKRFCVKALKCAYVYGFLGVALPTIFALILQFYLILPLHTWAVSTVDPTSTSVESGNNTIALSNVTALFLSNTSASHDSRMPSVAEHSFHILQDYALGLLYVRIASRLVIAAPASRAAEAFRRITADGYLDPNIRLATRFFVLPVILLSGLLLLLPPLLANAATLILNAFFSAPVMDAEDQTRLYRYSYPIAAGSVMSVLGLLELGKATSRWRARIRDEVYLVGERLHNFGEKKPPDNSKSVVRKVK